LIVLFVFKINLVGIYGKSDLIWWIIRIYK